MENQASGKRNETIDFMRFVFIVCVVLHHACLFRPDILAGYIGVEFFFIVSGYLAFGKVLSVSRPLSMEKIGFLLLHKCRGFYWDFLGGTIVGFFLVHACNWHGVEWLLQDAMATMSDLLLLQIWGFPTYSATGVVWYLSAMMSGLFILLPIWAFHPKFSYWILSPLCVASIYGFESFAYHHGGCVMEPFAGGFLHMGLLRAMAGMSLGMIAYHFSAYLHRAKFTVAGRLLLAVLEWGGYIGTILLAVHAKTGSNLDFLMTMLIFVSVAISFSGINPFPFNICSQKMATWSLYIFLNHFYVARVVALLSPNNHAERLLLYYVIGVFLCSVLGKAVSHSLKKIFDMLRPYIFSVSCEMKGV